MNKSAPLAARMRPTTLDDVVGQDHIIFPGSPLRLITEGKSSASVLLWGPPGCGKTTIASIIASETDRLYLELSATSAGVKDVRAALDKARKHQEETDQGAVLFIDEIHRFSKSQQDILLPAVEDGTVSLIGATTENPSFSVNSALVSRSVLLVLKQVDVDDIEKLLQKAVDGDPELIEQGVTITNNARAAVAGLSTGDVRQALNRLETAAATAVAGNNAVIDKKVVQQISGAALQRYDRDGDQHYDIISAYIKSMRGSDVDAALHWLARMIVAGEDPRFIARRLMIHAAEDVGLADPSVLQTCVAAAQAAQLVGWPEAEIILSQATIAVATAPKSPQANAAIKKARADVEAGKTGLVPMHLRDAHYPGAKALGHGQGYLFPHDHPYGVVKQQYLPDNMVGTQYYEPTQNGYEQTISTRLNAIKSMTMDQRASP